jgi:hypothetical protein
MHPFWRISFISHYDWYTILTIALNPRRDPDPVDPHRVVEDKLSTSTVISEKGIANSIL